MYFLEPEIVAIRNTHYPQATPIQSEHANYVTGEWKRDNQNGVRDTFALVANGDATVNINLHHLSGDLVLAVMRPDPDDPLNESPDDRLVSDNPGTAEEDLSLTVTSGQLYFIQVSPASELV